MATWHQSKNVAGMQALWSPPAVGYKVVVDRPHEMAFAAHFASELDAKAYADKTGGRVLSPKAA